MMNAFKTDPPILFSGPLLGVVTTTICPNQAGRIKFQGSYWPAKLHQSSHATCILPNQVVQVVGRQGITLLVREATGEGGEI